MATSKGAEMTITARWILYLPLLASLTVVSAPSIASAITIVDPDAFAAGTELTNAFPGVTLTTRDDLAPGNNSRDVTSETNVLATTGSRVFAHDSGNTAWGNGIFEFLRADFAGGASQVSLDFFANDSGGDTNAQLLAFDSSDTLVDSAFAAFVSLNSPVTLTVSDPNIAYIAAYWDEIDRDQNGGLDNLRFEAVSAVPESGTMTLLGLGLLGLLGATWWYKENRGKPRES